VSANSETGILNRAQCWQYPRSWPLVLPHNCQKGENWARTELSTNSETGYNRDGNRVILGIKPATESTKPNSEAGIGSSNSGPTVKRE